MKNKRLLMSILVLQIVMTISLFSNSSSNDDLCNIVLNKNSKSPVNINENKILRDILKENNELIFSKLKTISQNIVSSELTSFDVASHHSIQNKSVADSNEPQLMSDNIELRLPVVTTTQSIEHSEKTEYELAESALLEEQTSIFVETAIGSGAWTAEDNSQLTEMLNRLNSKERKRYISQIVVAINNKQIDGRNFYLGNLN